MSTERALHVSTVLLSGKVLVVGGGFYDAYRSAELYDPSTQAWTATGHMHYPRIYHTISALLDGKQLVTGGSYHFENVYRWFHGNSTAKTQHSQIFFSKLMGMCSFIC